MNAQVVPSLPPSARVPRGLLWGLALVVVVLVVVLGYYLLKRTGMSLRSQPAFVGGGSDRGDEADRWNGGPLDDEGASTLPPAQSLGRGFAGVALAETTAELEEGLGEIRAHLEQISGQWDAALSRLQAMVEEK